MNISEETVDRISKLCKLEFDATEKKELIDGLNDMLKMVKGLKDFELSSVAQNGSCENSSGVVRADNAEDSLLREKVLKVAPFSDNEAFLVPKTVEEG